MLVWRNVPALVDNAYEVIAAMLISTLGILVVSRLTRSGVPKGPVTS